MWKSLTILFCLLIKIPANLTTNAIERIINDGYPVEVHHIRTEDGYILEVHRIPKKHSPRSVVLILHGFIASSENFLCNGANISLGYQISDAGFDVWLGNFRGNTYSRNHMFLSPDSIEFWNYSFHEHGIYDIPAMIDYILSNTSMEYLHYIGHSMGTTAFLILNSEKPQYNQKIRSANLLAPIGYISNSISPLIKFACPLLGSSTLQSPNFFEIFPKSTYFSNWFANTCQVNSSSIPACRLILSFNSGVSTYTNEVILFNPLMFLYFLFLF